MALEQFAFSAIIAASISVVGKILYDLRVLRDTRCNTAAALAGEISAYARTFRAPIVVAALRIYADKPREERAEWLKSFPTLPSAHPVFDKVVDKVGTISPLAAQRVSETYNVVTGMRILMASMSTPAFLESRDTVQTERLIAMATLLEYEFGRFSVTVALLKREARQTFLGFLLGVSNFPTWWRIVVRNFRRWLRRLQKRSSITS